MTNTFVRAKSHGCLFQTLFHIGFSIYLKVDREIIDDVYIGEAWVFMNELVVETDGGYRCGSAVATYMYGSVRAVGGVCHKLRRATCYHFV
jgi:hypothetical protein